jgi:hypothetical protein
MSVLMQVDPATGQQTPLITGLRTAIEVIQIGGQGDEDHRVLQHSSGQAPFFAGPGQVLRFETPGAAPAVLADCFTRPTAMVFDEQSGTLYVAEYLTGRVVAMQL